MSGAPIRILVVDDHYVVRMGLVALVQTEPDLQVVGEAADGEAAVQQFQKLRPDLTLMDVRMPHLDGVGATRRIRDMAPEARILVLTTYDGDEDIHRALNAGASGYLLKNSTRESLIPALRAVAAGQKWIPREIAARLATRRRFEELTPREVEILGHLAKGLANKEIADVLHLSEHTVKGYLKSILGKLQVADRTEAVTVGLQRGIIRL